MYKLRHRLSVLTAALVWSISGCTNTHLMGMTPGGVAAAGAPRPPGAGVFPSPENGARANRGSNQSAPDAAGPMPAGTPISLQQMRAGGPAGDPVGPGGPWRLFNLRDDPSERHDLSRQRPDVLAQMLTEWNRYVADNGVIVKAGTVE